MAELVSKVQVNKKSNTRAKEYAHASEWPMCTHAGCPLPVTIKSENLTCGYHHRMHGFESECMTKAVIEHLPYIIKNNEMIYWNVRQWKEKAPQILGWPVLPATELEMELPTLYLTRLRTFIDNGIKTMSEELYRAG